MFYVLVYSGVYILWKCSFLIHFKEIEGRRNKEDEVQNQKEKEGADIFNEGGGVVGILTKYISLVSSFYGCIYLEKSIL